MARGVVLSIAVALVLTHVIGVAQYASASALVIDDSYTPTSRLQRYIKKSPQLRQPELLMQQGQRLLFDQKYKQVEQRELHLDMFLPTPERHNQQSIVMIHGGGWRAGHRSHFYPLANLLAQRGYTVVVPEYRLTPEARYPAAIEDLFDALIWLQQQSQRFSLKADGITVLGGSSGGHLAALLGYSAASGAFARDQQLTAAIKAVVDLDGVLDLTEPALLETERANDPQAPLPAWLGGTYQQAPAIWRQASPLHYLSDKAPASMVISSGAERFTIGRIKLAAHYQKMGINFRYQQLPNVIHTFWLFDPYVTQLAPMIGQFLESLGPVERLPVSK
ncbi:alpha/beta hydrolase [Neiella sp. HB171785]|uniref:Alpha/beta hydrolase n=1 Tax=Neiella litorisoli TaxID=2771431 RepID=A0A8J6QGK7_9GAMM|nr:alpha/beta hydrolase [Neiella litorisoli]MBD1389015.1 alpha/beta hydrolase [Neiella litorisoli]